MDCWLSIEGSRQRPTLTFCSGTMTKLLYYSSVSSAPSVPISVVFLIQFGMVVVVCMLYM